VSGATAAAELAVHAAASACGANADGLCDSDAFMRQVEALQPEQPGYVSRVTEAVRAAVTEDPVRYQVATQEQQPPRQWTQADVDAATPGEVGEAMRAGLLREHLHVPPPRIRGRR